jgi:hypothetical protein
MHIPGFGGTGLTEVPVFLVKLAFDNLLFLINISILISHATFVDPFGVKT